MGNWMNKPVIGSKDAAGGEKQSKGFFCDRADTLVTCNSIVQTIFVIVYMAGVATFIGAVNDLRDGFDETIGGEDQTDLVTSILAPVLYIPAAVSMIITTILLVFTFWRDLAKGVKVYFLMGCVPCCSVFLLIIFAVFAFITVNVGNLILGDCQVSVIDDEGLVGDDVNLVEINALLTDTCSSVSDGITLMTTGVIVIDITLFTMLIVSCIRGLTVRKDANTTANVQNRAPVVQVVQNYPAQQQPVYTGQQQQPAYTGQQQQPVYAAQQPQPVYTGQQPQPVYGNSQPPTPSNNGGEQQTSVEMEQPTADTEQ